MIERLLFMTCAAYLVAAFPACAQDGSSYHDSCGGDSCASDAYDLGYHDGYEGHSYSPSSRLPSNPQYDAGFSEGEMDAMIEKDAQAAEEQARGKAPMAPQASDRQTGSTPDSLLSAAMGEADSLTSQGVAAEERLTAPP